MANLTKSVSAFTIKKATFNLNEYTSSYSNYPLYRMIEDMIKKNIKQAEFEGVPAQVFEYFYDRSDFRENGEVETYYIVGYKEFYNMVECKKPYLAKFIYNRLMNAFNQYLSNTLSDTGIEEYQKLVDALDMVYNGNSGDINKSIRLVSELWDLYCSDDALETNWDIRDKITEGFQQSNYYKLFVEEMCKFITEKFENIKKANATQILLGDMLSDKMDSIDKHYGKDFQAKLNSYNELQSEIAQLQIEIDNL
jgi:hypothetical protein